MVIGVCGVHGVRVPSHVTKEAIHEADSATIQPQAITAKLALVKVPTFLSA